MYLFTFFQRCQSRPFYKSHLENSKSIPPKSFTYQQKRIRKTRMSDYVPMMLIIEIKLNLFEKDRFFLPFVSQNFQTVI
jgi:hypothetical protein